MALQTLINEALNEAFSDLRFNNDGTITYLSPTEHVVLRTFNPPQRDLQVMSEPLRKSVLSHVNKRRQRMIDNHAAMLNIALFEVDES